MQDLGHLIRVRIEAVVHLRQCEQVYGSETGMKEETWGSWGQCRLLHQCNIAENSFKIPLKRKQGQWKSELVSHWCADSIFSENVHGTRSTHVTEVSFTKRELCHGGCTSQTVFCWESCAFEIRVWQLWKEATRSRLAMDMLSGEFGACLLIR